MENYITPSPKNIKIRGARNISIPFSCYFKYEPGNTPSLSDACNY